VVTANRPGPVTKCLKSSNPLVLIAKLLQIGATSALGQFQKMASAHAMPAFPLKATELRTSLEVRFVPILLQKSFWGIEGKFLEPLVRFTRDDLRDRIASSKIDHRSP
jgi:hypothetical protein